MPYPPRTLKQMRPCDEDQSYQNAHFLHKMNQLTSVSKRIHGKTHNSTVKTHRCNHTVY
jgi:hypothetical protein